MAKEEDIEKFTRELQEKIMAQIRKKYSEVVIDHWQHPRHLKKMEDPDGYVQVKGTCGHTMETYIKVKDDKITDCSFQTDGCGTTIACGSMATEIARGKSFTQALALISAEEILKRIGGLPPADVHCAQLAAETLRRALADYLYQKRNPWKKSYRKI